MKKHVGKRSDLNVKDRVEFSARGRKVTGVVTGIRWKERKGKIKDLLERVGEETGLYVAEILDDANQKSFWTVDIRNLTIIGECKEDAPIRQINEIKNTIRQKRADIKHEHFNITCDKDLRKLKEGDPIIVTYKHNVKLERIFKGFVPSSGNVRYEQYGHIRTCSPKFVEVK